MHNYTQTVCLVGIAVDPALRYESILYDGDNSITINFDIKSHIDAVDRSRICAGSWSPTMKPKDLSVVMCNYSLLKCK